MLTKHKALEIEFTNAGNVLTLEIMITTECDHCGLRIVISLFGYDMSIHLYDIRHWDYENDCYVNYEKEIK